MKIDYITLGDHLPDPRTGQYNETQAERHRMWVDVGVHAETLGFSGIFFGEHHCSSYIISSPQMILAAIAPQTSRIALGTAVSLLPNNDPVRLAEDFATLDLLSNGRAEIGFGSGFTEHTFRLFGQDLAESKEISDENLNLLQTLWREKQIDWSGRYRAPIHESELQPRTLRGGPLPISRATKTSLDTARSAGLAGHKLMALTAMGSFADARPVAAAYRKAYQDAGHDKAGMSVSPVAYIHVHKDGKRAREFWAPYITNYRAFTKALVESKGLTAGLRAGGPRPDIHLNRESDFVGSPEEVVEHFERAVEAVGGAERFLCYFDMGGLSREDTLASMNLFADKVMPKIQHL
jgi:alkanesulfonate monooxygenase SsuD/methylene tetrahydromethanopterin reductase-like flavin-dependent oxidoreductase (luciferase family)